VAWKYVSYSGSAAIIGCVLGYFGGTRMFPYVIWKAYGMLYGFAPVLFVDDWWLFALSIIVALACSAGVTFVTCRAELTLMPAELMRPKSPKAGKRVLLERVKIIWNRLSFLQKVSFRNIFRYKKRLFMMALGIGGCTALLLTGFGIRNSITGIASEQYGEIMKYDLAITFDSGKTTDEIAKFKTDTSDFLSDSVFFCADSADLKTDKGIKTANIIATGDPDITKMINLSYKGKSVKYPPDGSVAVSDKLALFANVKVGDKITLDLSDGSEREVTVSDIFENHAYHYILMTDVTYKSLFGNECDYSDALLTVSTIDIHDASTKLLNDFDAVNVTVTEDIRNHINHMMVSLDYIIYVIIACAGALAFVVLFNLDNINITERVREIATIKVLGFYAPEVGSYVFRENIVLTTIGAAVGIPLGIWLNSFVMGQVDIDMLSFTIKINPLSYFLAIAITFAFDITVDLLMRRKLGAINMVESLKSVE
jgi:ABC-type transport system, involved in lipoprotein release, permease component